MIARTRAGELAARMIGAAFGGVSSLIALAGMTAPWRGSSDSPAIALVLLSVPMLILAAAFNVAAFWGRKELSRTASVALIVCELTAAAVFLLALHFHAFGGPP